MGQPVEVRVFSTAPTKIPPQGGFFRFGAAHTRIEEISRRCGEFRAGHTPMMRACDQLAAMQAGTSAVILSGMKLPNAFGQTDVCIHCGYADQGHLFGGQRQ